MSPHAKKAGQGLDAALNSGKNLIVFPEGTSTDGQSVLPFKSSLFKLFIGDAREGLLIQPFSVKVLSSNRKTPETQEDRDLYAWHIDMDMELPQHLWRFAQSRGAIIQLSFYRPVPAKDYNDRKTLAKLCHDTVSKGLEY